jgi:hypothetical protein
LMIWNAKCKGHFWLPVDAPIDFDRFYSIRHEEDAIEPGGRSSGRCFTMNPTTSSIAPCLPTVAFAGSEPKDEPTSMPLVPQQLHVAKPVEPSELLTVCASLVGRIN